MQTARSGKSTVMRSSQTTSSADMRIMKNTAPGTSIPNEIMRAAARKVKSMKGRLRQNSLTRLSDSGTGFG